MQTDEYDGILQPHNTIFVSDNVPLDLRGHITVICWSGVRGKINRTAQLCSIVLAFM